MDSGDTDGTGKVSQRLALLRLLRLIRILRVLRVGRIYERLSNKLRVRSAFFKIGQLVIGLMLVIHLLGCFFYLIAFLSASARPEAALLGNNTEAAEV